MLRLLPAQAAAEAAAATAQLDRHEIVIGLRQTRAGKTHQHAAVLDPCVQALARFPATACRHPPARSSAAADRGIARSTCCGAPRSPSRTSANGDKRAGEIEGRGQQRLRGIAGRAGDDADGAPPPAFVEQLHRAGGTFAANFQPRDVVADLDRQVERRFGFAILRAESVARLADRQSLGVEGANHARGNAAGRCAAPSPSASLRHFRRRPAHASRASRPRTPSACGRRWSCARASMNSSPRPGSTPSDSQTISASAGRFRKRSTAASASTRSIDMGFWRELTQRDARGAGGHRA